MSIKLLTSVYYLFAFCVHLHELFRIKRNYKLRVWKTLTTWLSVQVNKIPLKLWIIKKNYERLNENKWKIKNEKWKMIIKSLEIGRYFSLWSFLDSRWKIKLQIHIKIHVYFLMRKLVMLFNSTFFDPSFRFPQTCFPKANKDLFSSWQKEEGIGRCGLLVGGRSLLVVSTFWRHRMWLASFFAFPAMFECQSKKALKSMGSVPSVNKSKKSVQFCIFVLIFNIHFRFGFFFLSISFVLFFFFFGYSYNVLRDLGN